MRNAIKNGLIGDVYLVRGICAGDFLSDGTHTVDSMMFLNGDCSAEWVVGQIFRGRKATKEELELNRFAYTGTRFGHHVEQGALSSFQLSNGVRCETSTGAMMLMPGRIYQDIEVFGSKGRIWRNNDYSDPHVMINTDGSWAELPIDAALTDIGGLETAHKLFADTVINGTENPLALKNAMKGFEVVMSIYESARLNARIELPLAQDEFPLNLMIQDRGDF
jgi:predicted dehydrogenase